MDKETLRQIDVTGATKHFRVYAVILLDLRGFILSWNHGAVKLLGYAEEEAVGRHFGFIFTPEDRENKAPETEMENALSHNDAFDDRWQVRNDETRVYVNGSLCLIRNEKEEALGFLKILRDETDKRERIDDIEKLNQKLQQAHKELEGRVTDRTRQLHERNAELEAFCYSIAHDLRAPLRNIQAMSQVVIEDYGSQLDATCQDYLNRISRAGKRLDHLTRDLLKYSRVSREEIELTSVSLETAVEEVVSSLQETAADKGAVIHVRPPFPAVRAQHAYLVQILSNFVSNALKFVNPGVKPSVEIWTDILGDRVRLSVRDNGIGIPDEYREKIFQLFERLHPDDSFEGTGVGLAIAYKAALRINGSIGLERLSPLGTTFWLELETAR